jgi:hypothetical protein
VTIALAAVALLALGGCGSDDEPAPVVSSPVTTATDAVTTPTTVAPTAPPVTTETQTTTPTQTTPTTTGEEQEGGAGDEVPVRVPAVFTISGRNVAPERVRVPAFLATALTLVSADNREHTAILRAGNGFTVKVAAGQAASVRIPGLRPGTYSITIDGRRRAARLEVGGEPGP